MLGIFVQHYINTNHFSFKYYTSEQYSLTKNDNDSGVNLCDKYNYAPPGGRTKTPNPQIFAFHFSPLNVVNWDKWICPVPTIPVHNATVYTFLQIFLKHVEYKGMEEKEQLDQGNSLDEYSWS